MKFNPILLFISLFFFQCKEDMLQTDIQYVDNIEIVSGVAEIDTNHDGIGDKPLAHRTVVYGDTLALYTLISEGENQDYKWSDLLQTTTDQYGYYEFIQLKPATNNAVMLRDADPKFGLDIYKIVGIDKNPDGDEGELGMYFYIPVNLEENEFDTGNNFTCLLDSTSISGQVQLDNDGMIETIDYTPYPDVTVSLYRTNLFGHKEKIAKTTTGADGHFEFLHYQAGSTYSITLELENTGLSIWIASDESPDGDNLNTTTREITYIPVILDPNENDKDNNFIISTTKKPETPFIHPYWDRPDCPTDICSVDQWPIVIYNKNGEIIKSGQADTLITWENENGDFLDADFVYAHDQELWKAVILINALSRKDSTTYIMHCK